MGSNEAYLDSLLAALNGEQKKETDTVISEPVIVEPEVEETEISVPEMEMQAEEVSEVIEEPVEITPVSDDPNKALGADEIAALFAQANLEEEVAESAETEEMQETEVEEPIEITPVSDDPNKALGADEIAALFAQANLDMETGDEVEAAEEAVEEPIEITPVSDDPNKALGADEIAALFAQANLDMETGDEVEAAEEAAEEPIEITPVSDDPNKALGADEIAALFAQANLDAETGDEVEAAEEPIEITPVSDDPNKALGADEIAALFAQANLDAETGDEVEAAEEPIEITPVSDDPNKALGADEIAALFAQANLDMGTGDEIEEVIAGDTFNSEPEDDISIDDMLAQMEEDEAEQQVEDTLNDIQEEIEIDMDDPEALELLLGLGERPDWSEKKAKAEMSQTDEAELLAAMGEENPDLEEINSLLNKLDNNEIVGDGIEESVLVDFNEGEFDEEDPWLDELLGNGKEKKKKGKAKKEKKKFSLFGKRKKENEEEILNDELISTAEELEAPDSEEVTDILQAFAQDSSDIPFDLFAESDDAEDGELDLIALVEADEKKQGKKKVQKEDEKKGFFAKMLDVLTEEIPEEDEPVKEKKSKKDKKNKKKPVTDAEDNEGILEELDAEDDGKKGKKGKKDKKVKKEKKKKAPKQMDEEDLLDSVQNSKKLPMKMVVRIFALCLSVMALLLIITYFIPKLWSLADARNAFYKQDYETTYQEMSGKELSEADQRLYEKAKMILQLNHKVEAYANYKEMNMPVEALDSLLSGYLLWQQLGEKIVEYDAVKETDEAKNTIVNALSADYQISEEEAQQINALGSYEYTLRLEEITGSLSRKNSFFYSEKEVAEEVETEVPVQEETQQQKPTEDVLSEEEVQ